MKKKTIFITITLGLVTLLGLGFLGAINSQPKECKASEITTQPNKQYKKVTPGVNGEAFDSTTTFDKDKIYYMVIKNYSNQGKGYLWDGDSISLTNSAYMSSIPQLYNQGLYGTFDLINNGNYIRHTLNLFPVLNSGAPKLAYISLSDYQNNSLVIYSAISGDFNRQYCAFMFTNFDHISPTDSVSKEYFYYNINRFFNIYELQDNFFEFAETINYNATYGQDLDSFVISDNYFSDNSHLYKEVTLFSGVPFYSGGLVFDTITLSFDNAYATKFRTTDNNIQAWSSFNFGYFHEMRYKNSATNLIVAVNTRIFEAYYNANESGYYLTKRSKWISTSYQKITFFDNVQETNIVDLSKLNNTSYSGGYYAPSDTNIGLGNAFALISQAFTAWLPILQVSIVPGITLGLLIFLPLIAGIIIFIIWIVKR